MTHRHGEGLGLGTPRPTIATTKCFDSLSIQPDSHEIPDDMLSTVEVAELTQHEDTITRGLQTFVEVGTALAAIRDGRLYRQTHTTFEEYCADRWGFTDRRARQIIGAAGLVAELPNGTTVPVNEAQARELVGLDPTTAARVLEVAAASGRLTASSIAKAKANIVGTTVSNSINIADEDTDPVPTEAEIAEMMIGIIEAGYADDPKLWAAAFDVIPVIREWPERSQWISFVRVAYPLFTSDYFPSAFVGWLYVVAKVALDEIEDIRVRRGAPDWRPPGAMLAELVIAIFNPALPESASRMVQTQMMDQLTVAVVQCEPLVEMFNMGGER